LLLLCRCFVVALWLLCRCFVVALQLPHLRWGLDYYTLGQPCAARLTIDLHIQRTIEV
jgi:hypothetical protein